MCKDPTTPISKSQVALRRQGVKDLRHTKHFSVIYNGLRIYDVNHACIDAGLSTNTYSFPIFSRHFEVVSCCQWNGIIKSATLSIAFTEDVPQDSSSSSCPSSTYEEFLPACQLSGPQRRRPTWHLHGRIQGITRVALRGEAFKVNV
mmetsp:Transcript_126868/g.370959  ORF Transcript_126868/g.370959 Transcript_126868/m.370959 type:complete len:147 (+) Transcript_126868:315-755(+)